MSNHLDTHYKIGVCPYCDVQLNHLKYITFEHGYCNLDGNNLEKTDAHTEYKCPKCDRIIDINS